MTTRTYVSSFEIICVVCKQSDGHLWASRALYTIFELFAGVISCTEGQYYYTITTPVIVNRRCNGQSACL